MPSPESSIDVSVCIVSWNTRDLLRRCLESLFAHTRGVRIEVIVVDNASCDGSPEMIARDFPQVRIVAKSENAGFAAGSNDGMRLARGRYFLLLNSDTWIEHDVFATLVAFMDGHPDAGVGGCALRYPDGSLQPSCGYFPNLVSTLSNGLSPRALLGRIKRHAEHFPSPFLPYKRHASQTNVDWIVGACMMARREAVDSAGMMDESIFMFGEEWEWCMRIKAAGWRIVYTPTAHVVHVGSGSWTMSNAKRVHAILSSQYYIFRKHHGPVYASMFKAATLLNALAKAAVWTIFTTIRRAKNAAEPHDVQWHAHTLRWCLQRSHAMLRSEEVAPPNRPVDSQDTQP
jgi:GT2 family glycosyltransferase